MCLVSIFDCNDYLFFRISFCSNIVWCINTRQPDCQDLQQIKKSKSKQLFFHRKRYWSLFIRILFSLIDSLIFKIHIEREWEREAHDTYSLNNVNITFLVIYTCAKVLSLLCDCIFAQENKIIISLKIH